MIDRVHHVGIVLPDADEGLRFYRDVMGLTVTADQVIEEQGVRGVLLALGENEIELLEPVRDDTGVARFLASRGPTLHHICFNTDDIAGELARLKGMDIQLIDEVARHGLAGLVAFIHPKAMHGVLIELAQPPAGSHVPHGKGFDRLSARVADYQAALADWRSVIGLEELRRFDVPEPGLTIGQLRSGQCLIELIAPSRADSEFANVVAEQGEGAFSAIAIQVPDVAAEVARYRAAGITLPDPAPGSMPGTLISTISPDQTFGLSIQLAQYTA